MTAAPEWPRCATCRWAEQRRLADALGRNPKEVLGCGAVGRDGCTAHVYCDDAGDIGDSWLRVDPDFGCVMWEAKP